MGSREQSEEVKKLLTLMGVPVVDAPCEAEATCAKLAEAGLVFGTGTEDADALTFGTPKLIKNLNASEAQKKPIVEIDLARALEGLELTMAQFVDLCILMGCDYSDTIKGIGPVKGLELIKKHMNMEGVLAEVKKMGPKYEIPETFPYEEARKLFVEPEVVDCARSISSGPSRTRRGSSSTSSTRSSSMRRASRRPSSGCRSARARTRRTDSRASSAR